MRGAEESIPFPIGGRDDALASIRQDRATTPEATNVIGRVGVTGRYQGGRRHGTRKASPDLGGPAYGVTDLVVDTRHVNYAVLGTPTTEWTGTGPSGRDGYSQRVDVNGNVYTLEGGTHVVVRNSAGVESGTIVLPVPDANMRCRALEIDPVSRIIYVAVSEGGSQSMARLWAYWDRPYVGWSVLWSIEPGLYIEKLALRGDTLHAAANDTDTGRSYVVAYTNLGTLGDEQWREEVPAPANTLAVEEDSGKIAVGSGTNADRGKHPQYPGTGQILSRSFASQWLTDLSNYGVRVWNLFDAEELDINLGDGVFDWPDFAGTNRRFFVPGQPVQLTGASSLLTGANPNDGDAITFSLPDGSIVETYTFRTSPAAAGDIDIGANVGATIDNLEDAIENGGDGVTAHPATQPSALVFMENTRVRCNTQREVVVITLTYASTTQLTIDGSLSTKRVLSTKTVQPTAPTLETGIAGRRCVYFDGISAKLWSEPNPNKLASAADEQHTFWPGYGNNAVLTSSARFASFIVCRPYASYSKACLIAQSVQTASNNSWIRRIVSNRNDAGDYESGQIGIVERDGSTTRTHSASYLSGGAANFTLISQVSNPTGDYEVYVNGSEALNSAIASHTGTAAANDSLERTALGQSSYTTEDERFWHGDVYLMFTVHSLSGAPITAAERQAIEGILAWHFGAQGQLDASHPYRLTPPPPVNGSVADFHLARRALTTTPIVTKLDAKSHDIAWMAASDPGGDTVGGLGAGLAWDSVGHLYSVGPPIDFVGDPASVRRIIDNGTSYSLDAADGAWSATLGSSASDTFTYDKLELAVDEWDNLFVPFHADAYGGPALQFLMYDTTGTLVLSPLAEQAQAAFSVAINLPIPAYGEGSPIMRPELITLGLRREATSSVSVPSNPSNGDQVVIVGVVGGAPAAQAYTFVNALGGAGDVLIGSGPSATLANLAAAINGGAGSGTVYHASTPRSLLVSLVQVSAITGLLVSRDPTVDTTAQSSSIAVQFTPASPDPMVLGTGNARQIRLVDTSALMGTGRVRRRVAVVGSDLVRFDGVDKQTIAGGVSVIDPAARYYHSASIGRYTVTTDGQRSFVYDSVTDAVSEFVARDGSIPRRVQIWEPWRARLQALNSADNPARHYSSAAGNIFDWNYQPPVITPGQAWNSGLPPSFDIPDVLNGWIALDDDNAVIVGDSSLWWQTGDVAINGQADQITKGIGGAFGRAWCIGLSGEAYLWTSQNEIARIDRNGVQSITRKRIVRVLEQVDQTTHFIRMAWDHRQDAMIVMACPYNGVDAGNRVFQWEPAIDAWWELEFAAAGHRVHDLVLINGDELSDRTVLFTQADGYGRTWDAESDTDDGETIHSHVVIGPLAYRDARLQSMMTQLQLLLDGQSGDAFVEVWSSDRPSTRGRMQYRGRIRPGMSPVHLCRASGNYLWLILRGTSRWAFEQASAIIEPSGMKRRL